MPALTRGQARQWRAEGKDFEDPSRLGKKAPEDPPRITKKESTGSRPRATKASSAGGAAKKTKKSAKGKRAPRRGGKKSKSTINGANAAGQARHDLAVQLAPVLSQTQPQPSAGDRRIGMRGFHPNGLPATGNELYIPGLSAIRTSRSQYSNPEMPPTATASNSSIPVSGANVAGGTHNSRTQEHTTEHSPEDIMDASLDNPIREVGENQAAGTGSTGNAAIENRNTRPQEPANVEALVGHIDNMDLELISNPASAASEPRSFSPESHSEQTEGPTLRLQELNRKEVAKRGGLEFGRAAMPTLNNPIHDIWNPALLGKWKFDQQVVSDPTLYTDNNLDRDQKQSIVDTLTPAMRLATLWLTRPEYRDFWATIFYAPCTFDEERRVWQLAKETVDMTPARCNELNARLQTIGSSNHFVFENTRDWASTISISQTDSLTWRTSKYTFGSVTRLDPSFKEAVCPIDGPNTRRWQRNTPSSKLRFLFFLAVQLGGQAAELLWLDRCRNELIDKNVGRNTRIYVHDIEHVDLSLALQELVLGGRLQELNESGPMCSDGLALKIFEGVVDPDPGYEIGIVHTKGINYRFSSDWWIRTGDMGPQRLQVEKARTGSQYVLHDWAAGRQMATKDELEEYSRRLQGVRSGQP
ncbi:MAG: hypothetical protein L6R36_005670 [Xanthoria steineri]|nr:MAG: hypothetical protein L6R36_005670 [Xanthoria steineri]